MSNLIKKYNDRQNHVLVFYSDCQKSNFLCRVMKKGSDVVVDEFDQKKMVVEIYNVNQLMRGSNQQSFNLNRLSAQQRLDIIENCDKRNVEYFPDEFDYLGTCKLVFRGMP